jgi:predicted esterase YcpF (UPF0227 family)
MRKNREKKQQSILYIHGYNSSPLSMKAEQTREYFHKNFPDVNFVCPQLLTSPKEAVLQLEHILDESKNDTWFLIGSSLGGYFANYLSNKYQLRAVLINPAITPYVLLEDYLGE